MAGFEFLKCQGEIIGVRGGEMVRLIVKGEFQHLSVQSGAADQTGDGGAVECISQQWEPECVGMHAHLVRPPGGRNGTE